MSAPGLGKLARNTLKGKGMPMVRSVDKYEPKRLCISMSSWFCVPDQGMEDLEILCRSSCFVVKANNEKYPKFEPKYHIVTCSHVVAPWKWPKLYPDDFLKYVSEKHTHNTVEFRELDGAIYYQAECIPEAYHHPTRDLCVMHLSNEFKAMDLIETAGLNTNLRFSTHPKMTLRKGQELEFHGHELPSAFFDSAEDNRLPIPRVIRGSVFGQTSTQMLSHTTDLLENGMCGGPVIFPYVAGLREGEGLFQGDADRDKSALVAGMVEGIVPADHPDEALAGAAVFVESQDILELLERIESGAAKPVVGGDVLRRIAMDQNEDKMDLRKILGGEFMDPRTGAPMQTGGKDPTKGKKE